MIKGKFKVAVGRAVGDGKLQSDGNADKVTGKFRTLSAASKTRSKANRRMPVSRNVLYLVIGALVVATAVIGSLLYQERQQTAGIDISVGKGGISIETK